MRKMQKRTAIADDKNKQQGGGHSHSHLEKESGLESGGAGAWWEGKGEQIGLYSSSRESGSQGRWTAGFLMKQLHL